MAFKDSYPFFSYFNGCVRVVSGLTPQIKVLGFV
jgi:hypothetical protein